MVCQLLEGSWQSCALSQAMLICVDQKGKIKSEFYLSVSSHYTFLELKIMLSSWPT